jgi:hypothetical protein
MTVFDVVFVLLLCVCILLATMLVQNRLPAADGYSITWTAVLVLGAVAGLFVFIIVNSAKEWRGMIKSLYGEDAEGTGKEDK